MAQPRGPSTSVSVRCGRGCRARACSEVLELELKELFSQASPEQGSSMDSLLENHRMGVPWRVEEGICNVLITLTDEQERKERKMTSACRAGGLEDAGAKLRKEKAEMGTGQGVQCSFNLRPVGFQVFVASRAVEKLGYGSGPPWRGCARPAG